MTNNFDSKALKTVLKEIFKVYDEFVVPLGDGWYVPKCEKEKLETETYIGYRFLSKKVVSIIEDSDSEIQLKVKVSFRISFAGIDSEKFLNRVLFWKKNSFVREKFEKYMTIIDLDKITAFSYPAKDLGEDIWVVDFSGESIYVTEDDENTELSQKAMITFYIEDYVERFVKDEITLTAGEIRKWSVVDAICKNTNAPNICNAMKAVTKYEAEIIGGTDGSTTFKMRFKKRLKKQLGNIIEGFEYQPIGGAL